MKYLLLTLLTFSFMSFSQEEASREVTPGVWEPVSYTHLTLPTNSGV